MLLSCFYIRVSSLEKEDNSMLSCLVPAADFDWCTKILFKDKCLKTFKDKNLKMFKDKNSLAH